MPRTVSILGSTGSIGRQALDVVRRLPGRFRVAALAAGGDWVGLAAQVREFTPSLAVTRDRETAALLAGAVGGSVRIAWGEDGLQEAATAHAGTVLVATAANSGLKPTLAALAAGQRVALANKEALVSAGHLVMEAAKNGQGMVLPVDSEHSALFQCLAGERSEEVRRLILTASGGPFRGWSREELAAVTPAAALNHPRWRMGPKVTVDSGTLLNKGLEVIEAKHLFGMELERIQILIHPQSIIHSLVEFVDGGMKAQLGPTDMRGPIQYALTYPERLPGTHAPFSLATAGALDFEDVRPADHPCLQLALEAGRMGGTFPAVLSAADEVAVDLFLDGELPFTGIAEVIGGCLEEHLSAGPYPSLGEVLAAQRWAVEKARELGKQFRT